MGQARAGLRKVQPKRTVYDNCCVAQLSVTVEVALPKLEGRNFSRERHSSNIRDASGPASLAQYAGSSRVSQHRAPDIRGLCASGASGGGCCREGGRFAWGRMAHPAHHGCQRRLEHSCSCISGRPSARLCGILADSDFGRTALVAGAARHWQARPARRVVAVLFSSLRHWANPADTCGRRCPAPARLAAGLPLAAHCAERAGGAHRDAAHAAYALLRDRAGLRQPPRSARTPGPSRRPARVRPRRRRHPAGC